MTWSSSEQKGYRDAEYRAAKQHEYNKMIRSKARPWLTAISRRSASNPTKWLHNAQLIGGAVMDYGAGKGKDTDYLRQLGYNVEPYDPYHCDAEQNTYALLLRYDTIICNYVLNVLPSDMEQDMLYRIKDRLNVGGVAYITVRRDIKNEGLTKRRTYQRNVTLDLPIVKQCSSYCMYKLLREE